MEEEKNLSRRGFLAGSAVLGAGALAAGLVGCNTAGSGGAPGGASGGSSTGAAPARVIGVEEHYYPEFFYKEPGSPGFETMQAANRAMPGITELIGDLGDGRIARMDAAGVDVQVLSLGGSSIDDLPVAQATSIVRECNDVLADAISKNPTRLKGFVAIPAAGPDAAVAEIERCMKLDGFVGISVLSHISGGFLDQEKFTPILETAEKLETPIYIHPTYSIPAVKDIYYNVGNPVATAQFSQASWGWHIETAIHVLRLAFSGTFDRFPKLQIAVGHLGEGLPFFLNRLGTTTYAMVEAGTIPLQRKIPEYLRENVSYSIGAFNWKPPFDLLVEIMGVDRVLFSSDYPFSPGTGSDAMKVAMDFLMAAGLSDEDRNKVAYLNTEKLFKL